MVPGLMGLLWSILCSINVKVGFQRLGLFGLTVQLILTVLVGI